MPRDRDVQDDGSSEYDGYSENCQDMKYHEDCEDNNDDSQFYQNDIDSAKVQDYDDEEDWVKVLASDKVTA